VKLNGVMKTTCRAPSKM